MRYPYDHKPAIRGSIVATAARRYRAEGIQSVGIANLMADLGLTHGGFYSHFKDKESLVAEVCRSTLEEQALQWQALIDSDPANGLQQIIAAYLSQQHRTTLEEGCPIAALASEVARRDNPSRQAFTDGVEGLLSVLHTGLDGKTAHVPLNEQGILALMVGSLVLARAVSNDAEAGAFLASFQGLETR